MTFTLETFILMIPMLFLLLGAAATHIDAGRAIGRKDKS